MLVTVSASKILSRHLFQRHKALRWAVPGGALVVVAAVGSGMLASASANSDLPQMSAAQLLAAVEGAHLAGLSGTVVENAALGLPQLPSFGPSSDGGSLISMLSGSHTVRVWYAGPSEQRVALVDTAGETDVFHDGTELWQWDSDTQTATHTTLPASMRDSMTPSAVATITPQAAATAALAAIGDSTTVTVQAQRLVADRDAYELVLTPTVSTSRVGSVQIAVDGQTKVPLGVQVYARGDASTPALDVAFTKVDMSTPASSIFSFTPPKSATVKQENFEDVPGAKQAGEVSSALTKVGSGWTTVLELRDGGLLGLPSTGGKASGGSGGVESLVLSMLTPVSGTWGSGYLFDSKLLTGLVTGDGRVFVGAVDPQVLYAAAQK
jgi:outer membrane lipoprotein-sorting protein